MNTSFRLVLFLISVTLSSAGLSQEPERQMNLREGPESVFSAAPEEIFSELLAAVATQQNGRVGNELAFWGYRLDSGREAYLIACAIRDDVDCEARERRVCPGNFEVIAREIEQGTVRHVRCRPVALVAPGDIRPGCNATETTQDLAVSLISCL